MEPSRKLSPKLFFLSLGLLVSLIANVISFLNLVFATLDKRFPDVLNATYEYGYNTYSFESMRTALAALIIFFPVFLIISYFWNKATNKELGHYDEILKKWVIYLIVFLASVTVVVDLVTLVRYFISGEITSRFILKVISVLIVAKIAGLNYLSELNVKIPLIPKKKNLLFGICSVVLFLFVIIYGFFVMGSPKEQRNLRLDQKRTEDLQSIQYQVINYWQQKESLPTSLSDLKNPVSNYLIPVDPEFQKGLSYEYKNLGKQKFELCATFTLPAPKGWIKNGSEGYYAVAPTKGVSEPSMPYPPGINDSWDHKEGRTCFERTIDPELYPPFPKAQK